MLASLAIPIVGAPLAGGASNSALAAAVSDAGGLGFLASGYKTPAAMSEDVAAYRALTDAPFGVNVFLVTPTEADAAALDAFRASLGEGAGEPRADDDSREEKVERLLADPVPVVSFTFGCPEPELVGRFHAAGSEVWVTVTTVEEARAAAAAGADALVVQGHEAGGHRGSFTDDAPGDVGLLALLQLIGAALPDLPLVATGGIATGRAVAAVLAAGAAAAQIGTALMRTPEAATAPVHRDALARDGRTAVTRAFTGRSARGIVNAFMREHDDAPHAYPAVHHITAPLRARAREQGDPESLHLWAGQAHELSQDRPAGELVRALYDEARAAAAEAAKRLGGVTD
ncbi:MAG TPA: nitronate monooxygenase [Solirubrobacteraceae bacterium]|nr:nitronate monooxygenase [Solirubrobacteraceae bacterium]